MLKTLASTCSDSDTDPGFDASSITADLAREFTEQAKKVDMLPILRDISTASRSGDDTFHIQLQGTGLKKSVNYIMEELRKRRFKVTRHNGSDQREDKSWDYLVVQW